MFEYHLVMRGSTALPPWFIVVTYRGDAIARRHAEARIKEFDLPASCWFIDLMRDGRNLATFHRETTWTATFST